MKMVERLAGREQRQRSLASPPSICQRGGPRPGLVAVLRKLGQMSVSRASIQELQCLGDLLMPLPALALQQRGVHRFAYQRVAKSEYIRGLLHDQVFANQLADMLQQRRLIERGQHHKQPKIQTLPSYCREHQDLLGSRAEMPEPPLHGILHAPGDMQLWCWPTLPAAFLVEDIASLHQSFENLFDEKRVAFAQRHDQSEKV